MSRLSQYRVLIAGVVSPMIALVCYAAVYMTLTALSTNREKDWLFRLSVATLAMAVPLVITVLLAVQDSRTGPLSFSTKAGLVFAILSLGLAWKPVSDGILRWKQTRNLALRNVAAPAFNTTDLSGKPQRLEDQKGKVVLVNVWATWCGPCRQEMPQLDRLYQERKDRGLIVFGLSSEDPDLQQRFLQQVPVSYPLLTVGGDVPDLYRDIARYPALILIDRQGQLQTAPGPEEPFDKVRAAVDSLLASGS
jgi:thiol-disulfide isomerase/thioredoxin